MGIWYCTTPKGCGYDHKFPSMQLAIKHQMFINALVGIMLFSKINKLLRSELQFFHIKFIQDYSVNVFFCHLQNGHNGVVLGVLVQGRVYGKNRRRKKSSLYIHYATVVHQWVSSNTLFNIKKLVRRKLVRDTQKFKKQKIFRLFEWTLFRIVKSIKFIKEKLFTI